LPQLGTEAGVHLDLPVAVALVEEPLLAAIAVPPPGPHHGGRGAFQVARDLLAGASLSELGDHEEAERCLRVLGLSSPADQPPYLGSIEPGYCVHGKVLSMTDGVLANTTINGLAFPFNFLLPNRAASGDPDSCTVV
jgi:hypothetical protein